MKQKQIIILLVAILIGMLIGINVFAEYARTPEKELEYNNAVKDQQLAWNVYEKKYFERCTAEEALANAKLYDHMAGITTLSDSEYKRLLRKSETMLCLLPSNGYLNVSKFKELLVKYDSPIGADTYIKVCEKYPADMCRMYAGVMYHESKFCTAFAIGEFEKEYHNCSGWKSYEIMAKHAADENGSWLKNFDSYEAYYEEVLSSFYNYYWLAGKTTPETVSRKYVGKYSQTWVNGVRSIMNQL